MVNILCENKWFKKKKKTILIHLNNIWISVVCRVLAIFQDKKLEHWTLCTIFSTKFCVLVTFVGFFVKSYHVFLCEISQNTKRKYDKKHASLKVINFYLCYFKQCSHTVTTASFRKSNIEMSLKPSGHYPASDKLKKYENVIYTFTGITCIAFC